MDNTDLPSQDRYRTSDISSVLWNTLQNLILCVLPCTSHRFPCIQPFHYMALSPLLPFFARQKRTKVEQGMQMARRDVILARYSSNGRTLVPMLRLQAQNHAQKQGLQGEIQACILDTRLCILPIFYSPPASLSDHHIGRLCILS